MLFGLLRGEGDWNNYESILPHVEDTRSRVTSAERREIRVVHRALIDARLGHSLSPACNADAIFPSFPFTTGTRSNFVIIKSVSARFTSGVQPAGRLNGVLLLRRASVSSLPLSFSSLLFPCRCLFLAPEEINAPCTLFLFNLHAPRCERQPCFLSPLSSTFSSLV